MSRELSRLVWCGQEESGFHAGPEARSGMLAIFHTLLGWAETGVGPWEQRQLSLHLAVPGLSLWDSFSILGEAIETSKSTQQILPKCAHQLM